MKNLRLVLFSYLLSFTFSFSSGQQSIMVTDTTKNGQIRFANVVEDVNSANATESKSFLKGVLNTGKDDDFYLYKIVRDEMGDVHEKFQQTFKGLKVEFGEYIVHKDKYGKVLAINGDFKKIPGDFGTSRTLSFEDAIGKLKEKMPFNIITLPEEQSVEAQPIQESKEYEVVVINGYDDNFHLAYKVEIMPDIYRNSFAYIDCKSGNVIFEQPLTYITNAVGSAATLYSGTISITTDHSTNYILKETARGGTTTSIHTYNFNRAPAYSTSDLSAGVAAATEFTDNDNNWTSGEYDNANRDIAALDAHWGIEKTFDYFYTVHNRNSYNGNAGPIKNYVHVRTRDQYNLNNVIPMDNAFWNSTYNAIFYGDGSIYNPLVSLDVTAHEFAHGVCYAAVGNGTGLIYNKEPGALNESLSDMYGASVEAWSVANKQTWIIGEELIFSGLRSMSNPNAHTQPDTYQSSQYWYTVTGCTPSSSNDYCGVHKNSGVGNYWYYLLANGGSGTNDFNYIFSVTGIGLTKAAKIIYSMETSYLTSTSTFADARTGSIAAATALYGANSCETYSVKNAWWAVGVGTIPTNATISGNTLLCASSNTTFVLNNQPAGTTIYWNKSSNLTYVSGQGTTNYTVAGSSTSGSGWVEVTLSSSCGSITLAKYQVWVGPPNVTVTGDATSGCTNTTHYFTATQTSNYANPTSFSWNLVPLNGNTVSPYGYQNSQCSITFYNPYSASGYTVQARATNNCGTGNYGSTNIWIHTCFTFLLSPNPASETVTVTKQISGASGFESSAALSEDAATIYTIRIINYYGSLQYTTTRSGDSFTLPVNNLKDGQYIVQFNNGKDIFNSQLIVKH